MTTGLVDQRLTHSAVLTPENGEHDHKEKFNAQVRGTNVSRLMTTRQEKQMAKFT